MSAFGLSDTGKTDQGMLGQIPNWNWAQYQSMLGRANDTAAQGQNATNWAQNYNLNLANNGGPTVQANQFTGNQIMPGVDQAIGDTWGRLNQEATNQGTVPSASDTTQAIGSNIDQAATNIGNNQGSIQGDINDTYNRSAGRGAQANDAIVSNIGDTDKALEGNVNSGYGSLRSNSGSTYDNLAGTAGNAYSDAAKAVDILKPGGENQTATVGRNFAREVSDTAGSLRAAGVDPNSPQGLAAMQGAQRDRAEGMDTASGQNSAQYATAKSNLDQAQQKDLEGIQEGKNTNDINLGTAQVGATTQLGQNASQQYRAQVAANTQQQNALDSARSGQSIQNTDTAFQRGQDILNQKNNSTLNNRTMTQQDVANQKTLLDQQNQQDLTDLGLKDQQYQAGATQNNNDLAVRNAGANNVAQIGQNANNLALQQSGQGLQFGNAAQGGYAQSLGVEGANAGWGTKLIGGLIGAVPGLGGVGSAISGAGTYGPRSSSGTAASGGGYQTNGSTLGGGSGWGSGVIFNNNLVPQSSNGDYNNPQGSYDPAKTKVNPDGSLSVGGY